jgi:pyruvate dehydrogenase E2 component (dihydrolipoamide acetyltransferase)
VAEVELPQLGESVTEGIITAWLVEVGDEVDVDQPIVEISTDKVDTEIPSPVAGTVQELRAEVDDTIEVGQVIAVIGEGAPSDDGGTDDREATDDDKTADAETADDETDGDDQGTDADTAASGDADEQERAFDHADAEATDADAEATDADAEATTGARAASASDDTGGRGDGQVVGEKALTSPLVRRQLREAGLSPSDVDGTGPGGRITREDAERAIAAGGERRDEAPSKPSTEEGERAGAQGADRAPAEAARADRGEAASGRAAAAPTPPPAIPTAAGERKRPAASPTQIDFGGERSVTHDLTRVRKAIARSMMESLASTAQLTAAVEVDMTRIMNLRAAAKDTFKAKEGVGLSPLPMVARAVCMVLPRHPLMNSSMDQEAGTATFHRYVNLGVAVDTDRGLLVPNIKDAQDLTVPGLARRIADVATRTRNKKLSPDEIQGGTFTITNTGSVGTLFDTPILNPPEVAILATAAIEKRPVIVSDGYGDSIAIRWMTYLCLSYDHRALDGADAARFLQDLKYVLETHDFAAELGV